MDKEFFNNNIENEKFINEIMSKQKNVRKIINELEKTNCNILKMLNRKSNKLNPNLTKNFNTDLKQIKRLETKLDNLIIQVIKLGNVEDVFKKTLEVQQDFFVFLSEDKERLVSLENKLRTRIIQSIYFSTFKIIVAVVVLLIFLGSNYLKLTELDLDKIFKIMLLVFSFIYFYTSLTINEKIKEEKKIKLDRNFITELNDLKKEIKYSQQETVKS